MSMHTDWVKAQTVLKVTFEDVVVHAIPRTFQSGNVGYYYSGKLFVGEDHCQVTMSVVVIGSRGWKDTPQERFPGDLYSEVEKVPSVPAKPAKAKKGPGSPPKPPNAS